MKKSYSSPRLTEYGTVNNLTNIFGNSATPDVSLKPGEPLPLQTVQSSSDGILAQ
jgi:hypothetical protein